MRLDGVGIRYGRRAPWVLRDLSLTIATREVIEVTGRNGAGKSSLLRVLAGVLRPAAGRVSGRPRVVGWAPEHFPVDQPFSAHSYLQAQARIRGLSERAAAVAVRREVDRLHLGSFLSTPLRDLSKGSAQKVGIAQALLVPAQLLILDEPWAGLDADARQAIPLAVRQVLQTGGSVVVTDHLRQAAALPLSKIWHVADGTVIDRQVDGRQVDGRGETGPVIVVPTPDQETAEALMAQLRADGFSPTMRAPSELR